MPRTRARRFAPYSKPKEYQANTYARFLPTSTSRKNRTSKKALLAKTKELEKAEKRIRALDCIIQNLYEDKVSGNLTEEQFVKLSLSYKQQQTELNGKVSPLK